MKIQPYVRVEAKTIDRMCGRVTPIHVSRLPWTPEDGADSARVTMPAL